MTYPFTKTYKFDGFTYEGGEYFGTYEVNQDGEIESPCVEDDMGADIPEELQDEVAEAHWQKNREEMNRD